MEFIDKKKKLWHMVDSKRTDDKEKIKTIPLLTILQTKVELLRVEPELILNKNRMSELQMFNV